MRTIAAMAAALLTAACTPALSADVSVEYRPGLVLGAGYDTIADKVAGTCVTFEKAVPDASAGTSNSYSREVQDSLDLMRELGVSASASYSGGWASGSGKASLARRAKVNQFSNFYVVRSFVTNAANTLVKPRLDPAMAELARTSPADFRVKCGNTFAVSVLTGGELTGYVDIQTQSAEESEVIAAGFEFKSSNASASGNLDRKTAQALASSKVTMFLQVAGETGVVPQSIDEMRKKFIAFPASVERKSVNYSVVLRDYRTLDGYPLMIDYSPAEKSLERMGVAMWRLQSVIDAIDAIQLRPEQFLMRSMSPEKLAALKKTITSDLKRLEESAAACAKDGKCSEPGITDPDDYHRRLPLRYRSRCENTSLRALLGEGHFLYSRPLAQRGADEYRRDGGTADPRTHDVRVQLVHASIGDTEMGGPGELISGRFQLKVPTDFASQTISARVDISVKEQKADKSEFRGSQELPVLSLVGTPLEHCRFAKGQDAVFDGVIRANGNGHDLMPYDGTGILSKFSCVSDTKGRDAGRLYCSGFRLRDTPIKLVHAEDVAGEPEIARMKSRPAVRRTPSAK